MSEITSEVAAAGRIAADNEIGPFTSLMRLICKNILMHICITVGLMGNILTLIVLLEKRMRRASTTQYLATLTLFDSFYLIGSFINNIELNYPNTKESNLIPYLKLFFIPFTDFFGNTSPYLILMFTIERYLVVAYPLKSRYWCSPSRARKVIGLTILFCFMFTFPTFLENKIKFNWNSATNSTVPELIPSELYPNIYYFIYFWFISITFQIIPLTILIVLNSILMKYIHKSMMSKKHDTGIDLNQELNSMNTSSETKNFIKKFKKFPTDLSKNELVGKSDDSKEPNRSRRNSTEFNSGNNIINKKSNQPIIQLRCNATHQQSEQNKATLLLVATVLVFLVCQLPGAILLIYQAMTDTNKNSKISQDIILGLNNIANGLVAINASINFVLYSCFSEKFRQTFKRLFFGKKLINTNMNTNINNLPETTGFLTRAK